MIVVGNTVIEPARNPLSQPSILDLDLVSILIAAALAVITAAQVAVTRRQRALSELQVLHELAEQWEDIQHEWTGFLVMGGHFYIKPSPECLKRYPMLAEAKTQAYKQEVWFNHGAAESGKSEVRPWIADEDKLDWPQDIYRRPLGFLSTVSAYVMRNRVSIGVAYEVFGRQLTRNSGAIRMVTDFAAESTYYLNNYPGLRRRVLVLLDMMWAEAARLGDLDRYEEREARRVKTDCGSGHRNRVRLRREVLRLGYPVHAFVLEFMLTHSEVSPDIRGVARLVKRAQIAAGGFRTTSAELYPWRAPYDFERI